MDGSSEYLEYNEQDSKDFAFPYDADQGDEDDEAVPTKDRKDFVQGSFIPSHLAMPIVSDDMDFLLVHDEFFCKRH